MFKPMRRAKQLLSAAENIKILNEGKTGILGLLDEDGYPYTVPLNYVYAADSNVIYVHCAKTGHKIDAVKNCDKASFCVVDKDEVIAEKYTTKYSSVIAFGKIVVVEDEAAAHAALIALAKKYVPADEAGYNAEIAKFSKVTCVLALTVEKLTGKMGLELLKERNSKTAEK